MKFLVKAEDSDQYYYCASPEVVITANNASELRPAIHQIETLQEDGYYLAGWLSYGAGTALDPRQSVVPDESFPMLTMLASREVEKISLEEYGAGMLTGFTARIDQATYESQYQRLIDYILAGDLYQANFSFRADVGPVIDPYALFCQLEAAHPVPYAAYIETDDWQLVSLSPELFLKRVGQLLISEPMKGTVERGLTFAEDEQNRLFLESDEKNCAENLMIVDLMRNDLSKICEMGSVEVPELFSARRFPSLHQLVSRVVGRLREHVNLEEILRATFPAGSITGAPKIRAMEVISELESEGRKAYTGSVGLFMPGGDFYLNVAIRTLSCQQQNKGSPAELGVGSGVVANSSGPAEWNECLLKSDFLHYRRLHTEVFETMLWQGSFLWLEAHLSRLEQSSHYFSIPFDGPAVRHQLGELEASFEQGEYRVRLGIDITGQVELQSTKLELIGWGRPRLKLLISAGSVDSKNRYQYHKTDYRPLYEPGFKAATEAGFDEVLFLNEMGSVVEGAISNIFIRSGSTWVTPPVSSGLLAGIWRQNYLESNLAIEEVITMDRLLAASEILMGNSLRLGGKVGEIWFNGALIWQAEGES